MERSFKAVVFTRDLSHPRAAYLWEMIGKKLNVEMQVLLPAALLP